MSDFEKPNHPKSETVETQGDSLKAVIKEATARNLQSELLEFNRKISAGERNVQETHTNLREIRTYLGLPDSSEEPHSIQSSQERLSRLQEQKSLAEAKVNQSGAANQTGRESAEGKQELVDGYIENDPRYQQIEKELSDRAIKLHLDISKRHGVSEDEALFHLRHGGNVRQQKDGSLRMVFYPSAIHREFAQRFPQDYKVYAEREKDRVYENMPLIADPAYAELDSHINQLQDKFKPAAAGEPEWRGYTSAGNMQKHREAVNEAYDNFVKTFPAKAAAYRGVDNNIEEALKRQK